MITSLNPKRPTHADEILLKFVKVAAKIKDPRTTNNLNNDISQILSIEEAKIAYATPIYKKILKGGIEKNCPVSILNTLSEVCQKVLQKSFNSFADKFL